MERNPKEIANYFTMKRFKLASNPEGHDDKEYFDLLTDAIEAYADQQVNFAVEKILGVASEKAKTKIVNKKITDIGINANVVIDKQSILSLAPQIIEKLNQEK